MMMIKIIMVVIIVTAVTGMLVTAAILMVLERFSYDLENGFGKCSLLVLTANG